MPHDPNTWVPEKPISETTCSHCFGAGKLKVVRVEVSADLESRAKAIFGPDVEIRVIPLVPQTWRIITSAPP